MGTKLTEGIKSFYKDLSASVWMSGAKDISVGGQLLGGIRSF